MNDEAMNGGRKRHPIQVVARRTGLSADVLRVWERRYGVIEPGRTARGRRLYSDEDIERLLLLRKATQAGRAISQVAPLSMAQLRELVEGDEAASAAAPQTGAETRPEAAEEHLRECLEAVSSLDGTRLEAALSRAVVLLEPLVLIEAVVAPLMRRLGEAWYKGELSPSHEHLASGAVRAALSSMAATAVPGAEAPRIVIATPSGQLHEIGAMLAAAAAAAQGWAVTLLGADLPAEDIATAARATEAVAVALSLVHPPDDAQVHGELRTLASSLPEGTTLIVGGAASQSYRNTLTRIGAIVLDDTASLLPVLRSLAERKDSVK